MFEHASFIGKTALCGAALVFVGANMVLLGFDHGKWIYGYCATRIDARKRRLQASN